MPKTGNSRAQDFKSKDFCARDELSKNLRILKVIRKIILLVLSAALGVMCFYLVIGVKPLIFSNIGWLSVGDPGQHFWGWHFFRNSDWTYPLGLNPNYGMGLSSSIVYSDSIPIAAIVFKAIDPYLGNFFQYFGLWILLCFVLQSILSVLILNEITISNSASYSVALVFLFAPPFLFRYWTHIALMSHFLILWAIYLYIYRSNPHQYIYWTILLSLAACIHFYFLAMLFVIYVASIFDDYRSKNFPNKFIKLIGVLIWLFLVMWLVGYFVGAGSSKAAWGYGENRMNLLSIFNPAGASYLIDRLYVNVNYQEYEGFNYLGLGGLTLLFFSLVKWKNLWKLIYQQIHRVPYFFGALILLFVVSVTHKIGIGAFNIELFEMPLRLSNVLGILRASGRFFWPVWYCLLFFLVLVISNGYSKKNAIIIFIVASLLQVIDTSAAWLVKKNQINLFDQKNKYGLLENPIWDEFSSVYKNVAKTYRDESDERFHTFAIYAGRNNMATNAVALARVDQKKLDNQKSALLSAINQGVFDKNTLYIVGDKQAIAILQHLKNSQDAFVRIDGFNVIAPGWNICHQCVSLDNFPVVASLVPQYTQNTAIEFNRAAQKLHPYVLLSGWDYPQTWGVWAVDQRAEMVLPLPVINTPKVKDPTHLVLEMRALVNSAQPTQQIRISINEQAPISVTLDRDEKNRIDLLLDPKVIEDGYVRLVFELPTARRPKDIGIGDDDRLLSIGLVSAVYE